MARRPQICLTFFKPHWLPEASKRHPALLVQSCSYDTIGWGVEYAGEPGSAAVSAQWPTYFTADLACSLGSACTCDTTPLVRLACSEGHRRPRLVSAHTPKQNVTGVSSRNISRQMSFVPCTMNAAIRHTCRSSRALRESGKSAPPQIDIQSLHACSILCELAIGGDIK